MADAVKPIPLADIVERKIAAFAADYCDNYAKKAEIYARENAPWTDRTGQARKMIKGIVLDGGEPAYDVYRIKIGIKKDADGNVKKNKKGNAVKDIKREKIGTAVIKDSAGKIGIALAHRVDYGAALEEANDGRYGILKRTLEHLKPEFMADVRKYFG
jgi:hypothetical protein